MLSSYTGISFIAAMAATVSRAEIASRLVTEMGITLGRPVIRLVVLYCFVSAKWSFCNAAT